MIGETPQERRFDLNLDRASLATVRNAIMLDDQAAVLATARAQKESHNKTYLQNYQSPEEPVIHVGDIHNQTSVAKSPDARKSGLSPLIGGLIGAGLMATGIGGYFGLGMVADAISKIKAGQTVVQPVTPGDGNTKYELELLP